MKYLELLKRQKTPTQGTVKTALTPFGSKGSTQGSHFLAKKEFTETEMLLQQLSSDWRQFCDSHERSLGGYCPLKRDSPQDQFTDCVGWQMKTGKEVIH